MGARRVDSDWLRRSRTGSGRPLPSLPACAAPGLTAPLVVDGAMNGEIFRAYVEQVLAPTLQPDDIVILDNLSSHKVTSVRSRPVRRASFTCRPTALTS